MAYMTKDEWIAANPNITEDVDFQYNSYLAGANPQSTSYGSGGTGGASPVFSLPMAENKLAPGVPAYSGFQEPNYGSTTPNNTHWLNTMNAYAPQGRADMERMLGIGQTGQNGGQSGGMPSGGMPSGGLGRTPTPMGDYRPTAFAQPTQGISPTAEQIASGGIFGAPTPIGDRPTATGVTQPTQNFSPTAPATNYLTPDQYPHKGSGAPGYMDAFYNVPGTAYTQQSISPTTSPTAPTNLTGGAYYPPTTGLLGTQDQQSGGLLGNTLQTNYLTPDQYKHKGSGSPTYMDAFYNVPGTAYPGTTQ